MQRIYAQLQPDAISLKHLLDIQAQLPALRTGRKLPAEELHVTLIHFGKPEDIYGDITNYSSISKTDYEQALQTYINDSKALLTEESYTLQPLNVEGFGKNGKTLVVTYTAPQELHILHGQLHEVLISFLQTCEVADPKLFISQNNNLQHSAKLTPHITLYKGFEGERPDVMLQPIQVSAMELLYKS